MPQSQSVGLQLEKKIRLMEKSNDEWKKKCNEISEDVEKAQREEKSQALEIQK